LRPPNYGSPSTTLTKTCRKMSRRDGAIIAWHEVPGTAPPQKSRVGVGRVGVSAWEGQVQGTAIISSSSSNIIGHEPFKKSPCGTWMQRHLAKASCQMSRRDDAIVAWHEVPGTEQPERSRPVGYGLIRAGVRRSDDWGDENFEEKHLWDLAAPDHTVPSGTVLLRDAFPGTACQVTIGVVPTGHGSRHLATALGKLARSSSLLRRRTTFVLTA
jgi:hypothetical protein